MPVINLIAKKPVGILHLLDDESNFPKATDLSFLEKCHYNHALDELYSRPRMSSLEFGVRHYAGQVWYNVEGFLDKNRDTLRPDVVELLISSKVTVRVGPAPATFSSILQRAGQCTVCSPVADAEPHVPERAHASRGRQDHQQGQRSLRDDEAEDADGRCPLPRLAAAAAGVHDKVSLMARQAASGTAPAPAHSSGTIASCQRIRRRRNEESTSVFEACDESSPSST